MLLNMQTEDLLNLKELKSNYKQKSNSAKSPNVHQILGSIFSFGTARVCMAIIYYVSWQRNLGNRFSLCVQYQPSVSCNPIGFSLTVSKQVKAINNN